MAWIIAPALERLRKQLNEAFPNRSKASDGGIGDEKHASRSSDHNPWVKTPSGEGVVTARDFTHDPRTGIDCQWLADTLTENRDERIKYIIWNKQICSAQTSPWQWRPYKGTNAHKHHLHLSVSAEPKLYNSVKSWVLDFPNDEGDDIAKVSAALPPPSPTDARDTAHLTPNPAEQGQPIEIDLSQPVTETKTTEVTQVGLTTLAVEQSQTVPAGDPPEAAPTQVSQNGPLAQWIAGGGGLAAIGSLVWGYIQSNPSAVGIAVICITLLIIAIIFRGAITDAIRMQTAADPEKKNVT